MQTVVLAGGGGARMGPLSARVPKALLPVADRPLLGHTLAAAAAAGASEFIVVTGEDGPMIREALGTTYRDRRVSYVPGGQSDDDWVATAAATDGIDGPVAVLRGDSIYRRADVRELFENGENSPAMGVRRDRPGPMDGRVAGDGGRVTDGTDRSGGAEVGAYVLPSDAVDELSALGAQGEPGQTGGMGPPIQDRSLDPVEFDGWLRVRHPWDLLAANETRLAEQSRSIQGEVHPDATVTGAVIVERGATIHEGSTVEGPTRICSGSTVGPHAYVRGATLVGQDVKVGHGVELKNSVVMAGSAIPHLSYVGDSIVGRDVNLGAGTMVANLRHDRAPVKLTVDDERISTGREKFGAVLGHGVKTGINTSLNPGVTLSCGATTGPGETVTRDR